MNSSPFDARPKTLGNFLTVAGSGFYIPSYQRPYRWTKEHVSRLIADIVDGTARFRRNNSCPAFIGTIITVNSYSDLSPPALDRPNRVDQVIDGQQRIATLLGVCGELYRAIYSTLDSLPDDQKDSLLKKISLSQTTTLQNALSFKISETDHHRLPRMIRSEFDRWDKAASQYNSDISKYLTRFNPQQQRHESTNDHIFDEALNTIRRSFTSDDGVIESIRIPSSADEWISRFGRPQPSIIQESADANRLIRLLAFSSFMLNHVYTISVESGDPDSAYSIFESLNTTGELLTAFETFVPLVVHASGGQQKYVNSDSQKEMRRFANLLNDLPQNQVTIRTKKALVAFALSDTGRKLSEQLRDQRAYLRTYRDLPDRNQEIFLTGLGSTADCVKHLWHDPSSFTGSSERTRVSLRMLIDSKHTIPQGLLVRGFEEFKRTKRDVFHHLIQIVADFWLLWRLSHSNTGNIDGHHRELMAGSLIAGRTVGPYCRRPDCGNARIPYPSDVADDLRWILRHKGGIDKRETWVTRVSNLQHGSQSNKALLKYALLGAYHDSLATTRCFMKSGAEGSSPTLILDWYNAGLTVEHIAPQARNSADSSIDGDLYGSNGFQKMGNLTLLPEKENVILGNKGWEEKKRYFKVMSDPDVEKRKEKTRKMDFRAETKKLLSSRFVPFCADLGMCKSKRWDTALVEMRGRRLANRIWERFAPTLGYRN